MNWFQGPIDDHAVFWGLQAFWWIRITMFVQLMAGSTLLLHFLTDESKRALSDRLAGMATNARNIKVHGIIRLQTLLQWFAVVISTIAGILSLLIYFTAPEAQASGWNLLKLWIILAFILAMLSIPVGQIVFALSAGWNAFRTARKFTPIALAWVFHHERIDKSANLIAFGFLFFATALQIYLS